MDTKLTVLFMNIEAGSHRKELIEYLTNQCIHFDIACFTEVSHLRGPMPKKLIYRDQSDYPAVLDSHNLLTDNLHIDYEHRFDSAGVVTWNCLRTGDTYHNIDFGSSIFHRRHGQFTRFGWGAELIHIDNEDGFPTVLQWICVFFKGRKYLIAHMSGAQVEGNAKGDSPERTLQSRLVNVQLHTIMMRNKAHFLIFGGNFRLDPNTDALYRLEGAGSSSPPLRNLIREYGKEGTKTTLHPHPEDGPHFGDYVLVSQEVNVTNFTVSTLVQASASAPMTVCVS